MLRILEFRTTYRASKDPFDEVLIAPLDDLEKTGTWHRVSTLIPPDTDDITTTQGQSYKAMVARWSVIGPAYEAWKNGEDLPEEGTPLAAWSGITPEQAKFLKQVGIRTVEEVRGMGDSIIEKLRFPNARKLPGLAKSWLEGAAVSEKDAQIAEMAEKMKAMEELLEEALKAKAEPKRGPGRPKKTEAA